MFDALKWGSRIGVVALSNWIDPAILAQAEQSAEAAGFMLEVHPNTLLRHGRFAGTDAQRLQALHDMYARADIKAIICARGGYGALRFIDGLDYGLIKENPKPLMGYSDVTALLNPIAQRTGQATFHGSMLNDFRHNPLRTPDTWEHIWRLLKGENVLPHNHPAAQSMPEVLVPGEAEGPIYGGNLAVLAATYGTPTEPDLDGAILMIEEIDEDLYRFDRLLWQLKRAGAFNKLRGVIVGELLDVADKGEPAFGQDARELLADQFGTLDIPVVLNYPCGHGVHRTVLPFGVNVQLKAHAGGVTIGHDRLFA